MLDRRTLIGTLGASAALAAMPAVGKPARAIGKPPRLRPGDIVGIIEPAGFSDGPEQLARIEHTIRGMGLVPKFGAHVAERYGYLAGTDEARAEDVMAMYSDPDVRAVFAARGGWGSARILPLLNWEVIRANPKLLVGSSDITALHCAFAARARFPTIHAPNAASSWPQRSWESFWRLAFAGSAPLLDQGPRAITTITPGKARGRLLGGNLSVLSALVGTPWLPDFSDAILFLEDVGEAEYRIDRMLSQLQLSGILGRLAGVIFGQCRGCSAGVADYIGFTLPQVLEQYFAPLGIPAFHGANIGHVFDQLSLPVGAEVEMDAGTGTTRVLQPITA
jgi:muramoyltetrapeptide carboxypeptidase